MIRLLRHYWHGSLAAALALVAALAVSACGGSSSTTASTGGSNSGGTSTSSSSTGSTTSAGPAYSGPERNLPHNIPDPKIKSGFHYTVALMSPNASIVSLQAVIAGARAETQKLGGKFILEDAQLNPGMQQSQINQLITQGVNAIMLYPVNPATLKPGIAAAVSKGIKIVTEDTPPIAGSPLIPGTSMNVLQGRDAAAFGTAQAAAKADPGGSFVNLGLAVPVPLLQYGMARDRYWATKFGMKYLGEIDTTTDTPGGAAAAMTSILAKYPKATTIFGYNDQAAEAASSTARASGKLDLKIWGDNGEPVALKAIEAGRLYGTFNSDFTSIGRIQAIGVYDLLTHQNLPLPKYVSVGGLAVTKANAASTNPLGSRGPLPPPA